MCELGAKLDIKTKSPKFKVRYDETKHEHVPHVSTLIALYARWNCDSNYLKTLQILKKQEEAGKFRMFEEEPKDHDPHGKFCWIPDSFGEDEGKKEQDNAEIPEFLRTQAKVWLNPKRLYPAGSILIRNQN